MKHESAIAVLHFNKIRLTRRCLDSLAEAGVSPKRIFCLDNGSMPDVAGALARDYPDIRHHRLEENRGFSGGFNAALVRVFNAGFHHCVFLTNDTVYHSGADICLARALAARDAGMAAPCIRYLSNPDAIDSLGAFFDAENAALGHYHDIDLPERLNAETDYIPGTALAVTRDAFEQLGGTDESFHTYWEDVDLCFRAHAAGIPLIRVPGARIDHGVGQTCHKKPYYTTYLFQRNRLLFCRRHLTGDALAQAEGVIRKNWLAMRDMRVELGDRQRLQYIDKLLMLL
ncbi:MAG TPA: glycosyltransferase family 2 protein [bacterium]|nr:glycosyltransferase family 2 protein [bacterium]